MHLPNTLQANPDKIKYNLRKRKNLKRNTNQAILEN